MYKFAFVIFATLFAVSSGTGYGQPYPGQYGQYPGQYPSGPGLYPGSGYPSQYPGVNPGPPGPPGAHPGCPLCDSSVYSYCSHKQFHDSCCCNNQGFFSFECRKKDCSYIYANTCEEYDLISSCCCVDLQKSAPLVPVAPVAA